MRVLVVDDQEDLRELLRVSLSIGSFDVVIAASGREAFDILAADTDFDVVVLDVQMPDVDGWEVLEAIRNAPATARLPVVMCTVKSSRVDAERAWTLGCDGYVTKPFNVADFVEDVRTLALASEDVRRSTRERALMALQLDAVDGHASGVR
jgi:CheY-like chemotaxis protein